MPQKTQHPPQSGSVVTIGIVVGHHLGILPNAEAAEYSKHLLRRWQRMPPTLTRRPHRDRKILLQMGVDCTGDMGGLIMLPADRLIEQIKPAINDHPVRIGVMAGQSLDINNCGKRHCHTPHDSTSENKCHRPQCKDGVRNKQPAVVNLCLISVRVGSMIQGDRLPCRQPAYRHR